MTHNQLKKLEITPTYGYAGEGQWPRGVYGCTGYKYPDNGQLMDKINELVERVNMLEQKIGEANDKQST
jgi:hypothetical protein